MMMSYEEVLTLAKAGFTAQQIGALAQLGKPEQRQAVTDTNYSAGGVGQLSNNYAAVDRNNHTQTNSNPMEQRMDYLNQQLTGLTQALQLGNIANINQPDKVETTDDILASIINPPNVSGGCREC